MKIAGKKIPRGTLLLAMGALCVAVCTLMMSAALRANRLNELQSREFYSDLARKFSLMECEDGAFLEALLKEKGGGLSLYHQIVDDSFNIRGVYNQEGAKTPEMVQGRFFQEGDQFRDCPSAVVGQDMVQYLAEEDGEQYFCYRDRRYLVLGVMGYPWKSRIDRMVYLDFASGLEAASINGEYVLDGKNTQRIEDFLDEIRAELEGGGRMAVAAEDIEGGITMLYSGHGLGKGMYLMLYISFFLSVVVISSLWVSYRCKTIMILQMVGYTAEGAWLTVIRSFLAVVAAAWAAGMAVGVVISGFFQVLSFRWDDVLFSLAATVAAGLLAVAVPLGRAVRREISTGMR